MSFSAINGYRFRHNFECSSPIGSSQICKCGGGIEDKHFLLHCVDLFRQLPANVNGLDIGDLDSNVLCNLRLFVSNDLTIVENRAIIEATILFNKATKRLE